MTQNSVPPTAPASSTSPSPTPPSRPGRKLMVALAVLAPIVVSGYFGWSYWKSALPQGLADQSLLQLDLTRPDALIESTSLSSLPKDLLRVPLLRDTLTEDFVFYYEANADRLGLTGSLRRIAYEHELELRDSLISELLDQPADVALWRGRDGKLKHVLLVLQRGALARLLQPLAEVALNDRQLSRVGQLRVDGDEVPVYRLRYNLDRSVLFAAHGDYLLVLSSPGMLLDSEGDGGKPASAQAELLESLLEGEQPFPDRFGLKAQESTHRLSLSADYLMLGYGQFAPALAGVRFEMNAAGWQGFLALNPVEDEETLDFAPLWQAMPMGAGACVALPVSNLALNPLFKSLTADKTLPPELAGQLNGPAAVCWYGKSRLHTPLIVTRLAEPDSPALDHQLAQVFDRMIGSWEASADNGRFPVTETSGTTSLNWQRMVGSAFGLYPAGAAEHPEALSASRFFRVSLARHGDTLLFSLDDKLVKSALDTLDKRFPPLAEQLPADHQIPAYLVPASLASLLEQETLNSLPGDMEAIFRNAAETSLLPKLRAMGKHGGYALTLPTELDPDDDWTWLPLQWTPL